MGPPIPPATASDASRAKTPMDEKAIRMNFIEYVLAFAVALLLLWALAVYLQPAIFA